MLAEHRIVRDGQSVLVPAGTTHGYQGISGVAAHVLVELEPAGRMADFFADIYRIDPAHRDPRTGAPRLRAAAAVLRRYPQDIIVPGVPGFVLSALAR